MSGILIVRLRSDAMIRGDMLDTLQMLNLTRVNHATIVPDDPVTRGMLRKVKDWVTFGTVSKETALTLLSTRGETRGGGKLTDAVLAEATSYKTLADYAGALAEGRERLGIHKLAEGSKTRKEWIVKPVFRLHPPKQGHEGIKHSYVVGGALGERGKAIDAFVGRML